MDLEEKLRDLVEQRQGILEARKHLEQLQERFREGRDKLDYLQEVIESESRDVRYYEEITAHFLFRSILGRLEKRLQAERKALAQARQAYRQARRSLEVMEYEKTVLEEKVARLPDLENQIDQLKREREAAGFGPGNPRLSVMHSLNRELGELIQLRREIYEAKVLGLQSAQTALSMIQLLRQGLEHQPLGVSVPLFRRKKQPNFLQLAIDKSDQLKQKVWAFLDELRDVQVEYHLRPIGDPELFRQLSRGFFDHLINDWILHRRIDRTLQWLGLLHDSLLNTLESLKGEENRVAERIRYLEVRKKGMITTGPSGPALTGDSPR